MHSIKKTVHELLFSDSVELIGESFVSLDFNALEF
jgi:hypothetical protein